MIEFNLSTGLYMLFFGWLMLMLLCWLLSLWFPNDILD